MITAAAKHCRISSRPTIRMLRRTLVVVSPPSYTRPLIIVPPTANDTRRLVRGAATLTMPTAAAFTPVANMLTRHSRQYPWLVGGAAALAVGCAVGQYYYGYQKDFFEYRFILNDDDEHEIDPDDLAAFYGGEEFMELFCVVPFMGTLMMRGGHFDEEGTVHTTGFPGEMQVSMVFSDETNEDDGKTKWFNKRERFRDVLFGSYTCWDMVTNFGFQQLDDGRIMVYHHGEYFTSRFPPFSLVARLIFGLHARWVAWATEHYLHHYAFRGSDNVQDEALEEQARADMPLFLLTHYGPSDLKNLLFGDGRNSAAMKPSFLLRRSADEARARQVMDDELTRLLPVYSPRIQRHITIDIQHDRANAKSALVLVQHHNTSSHEEEQHQEMNDGTTATTTMAEIPLHVGLRRTATLTRRMTKVAIDNDDNDGVLVDDDDIAYNSRIGLGRQHKGGSAAWESVRATNDPKAYQAVTLAARERQLQRKATLSTSPAATDDDDDSTGATTPAH